jgi:hypothetical protein
VPGVDFAKARAMISLADVLGLIGFTPTERIGDQVRGPCPLHSTISARSRSFSANLQRHIYRCFKCGSAGNQLDLYAAFTGVGLFQATIVLCGRVHAEVPWIQVRIRGSAGAGQVAQSMRYVADPGGPSPAISSREDSAENGASDQSRAHDQKRTGDPRRNH